MKKVICVIGIILTIMCIGGCGEMVATKGNDAIKEEKDVENVTDKVSRTEEREDSVEILEEDLEMNSNSSVFSTEYDIEDYEGGYIIVSKNDGLLYGVLDSKGNEIIPVEYDNIRFMTASEQKKNIEDEVFAVCEYEREAVVVDTEQNEILRYKAEPVSDLFNGYGIDITSPYLGHVDKNSPYFCQWEYEAFRGGLDLDAHVKFYSKRGELLCEINAFDIDAIDRTRYGMGGMAVKTVEVISNNCFLISIDGVLVTEDEHYKSYTHTALYNMNGEVIYEWNNLYVTYVELNEDTNEVVFAPIDWPYNPGKSGYELYSVNENGVLTDQGALEDQSAYVLNNNGYLEKAEDRRMSGTYYLGENNEYRLYQSNDTWKLEDATGNPVYDMRYYDCWHKEDCFFLLNEDNELCLINQYGEKIIDYGLITWNGESGFIYDTEITDDNFRSDGQSACFEVKNGEVNDIYIFGEGK